MFINRKQKSVYLFKNNGFGNNLKQWYNLQDALNNECNNYALRYNGSTGNGFCIYDLTKDKLKNEYYNLLKKYTKEQIYISEMINNENIITLQGELYRSENGLYLTYSEKNINKMRIALKESKVSIGLNAKMLLQKNLDCASYDCIMDLLDIYIDHIVEFTTCEKVFGSHKRNTIIWEVRKY